MAINLQRNFINLLGSRILTIYEFHMITIYLHLNCGKYGKKSFNPPQSTWHIAIQWKSLTNCMWCNSCIDFRHTSYLFWICL